MNLRHIILALAAAPSALAYTLQYVGCYSTAGSMTQNNTWLYQSNSYCQTACIANNNAPVLGLTQGNACYCGSEEPPASAKVDDSQCNVGCTGYDIDDCGGQTTFSVYLTGTESNVGSSETTTSAASSASTTSASSGNSGSSSTSETPTAVTSIAAGKTVIITETPEPTSGNSHSSSGGSHTNAGAIAGGIIGAIAALALIGGALFYVRHRRRRSSEQYQQHQESSFIANTNRPVIPAVRRSPSGPDSRFDSEAMAHRRLSDGSIADNEDFSRRILQVTNPDDRA